MTAGFRTLFQAELRRQLNLTSVMVVSLLALIGSAIASTPGFRGKILDATNVFFQIYVFLVPVGTTLLAAGIVANDVKDGWLRSLLIRPITRQAYLLAKLLSTFCVILITLLVAGGIPFIVRLSTISVPVEFSLWKIAVSFLLLLGQTLTYLAILSFFSCWLPGLVNVALFAAWGMLAQYATFVARTKYSMVWWGELLKEYSFPSGFSDSIEAIVQLNVVPYSALAWGIAELAAFLALALWSVNKIQVDKSTEMS